MTQEPGLPELAWAKNLSELNDSQVRAKLQEIAVEKQVALVVGLGWKDRLKIIANSDLAEDVVKALPEEEVFLTLKGAGEQDSLSLVALTTGAQLRFILDVELWTRETVDETKARKWLWYVLSCGEAKVMELAETADRELIVIMLSKLISLVPNEEGVRVPEGLPSIMPDEYFTILSNVPQEIENVRLLLRILRQWNRDEFYKILFEIHGCMGAEIEEQALRWRNSRLEEKGLLEFDEAVEIYGYIGEDEAKGMIAGTQPGSHPPEPVAAMSPAYPVLLAEGKTFFYDVLTGLKDSVLLNRLRGEIAFTANRLLVADAREIGEIDSLKAAVKRLFSHVNVGLLFLAGSDRQRASEAVTTVPVKELFQIGFSRVMDLRTRARSIASKWWPEWQTGGFRFLDFPQDRVMSGLMLRVPQYHIHPGSGDTEFRDFETMVEVHEVGEILDGIEVVSEACFDKLGIPRPHEAAQAPADILAGGIGGICFRNLLMTIFVNFILKRSQHVSPLSRDDLKDLFEKVLEKSDKGERLVRTDNSESFLSQLSDITGYTDRKWEILKTYFTGGIRTLEEEVGKATSWEDLDPRYIGSLIFSRQPRPEGRQDDE
jgi:hypothetical protein